KENCNKLDSFCEWVTEMDSKISTCNVVQCNAIENTLKKLHMLIEEHIENQDVLLTITKNLVQPDEVIQLDQTTAKFKNLQDILHKKKLVLEKINEFFNWNTTIKAQLDHLEFKIDSNQVVVNIFEEVNDSVNELKQWRNNWNSIENLLNQSNTTVADLSFDDCFRYCEGKISQLNEKIRIKEEHEQKIEQCQSVIINLSKSINDTIDKVEKDIVDLLFSVKHFSDIQSVLSNLQNLIDINSLDNSLESLETEIRLFIELDKSKSAEIQCNIVEPKTKLSQLKSKLVNIFNNLSKILENWQICSLISDKLKSSQINCKEVLKSIDYPNDVSE
ncbi:uncharacterized protein LOC126909987, partial [Daktulosphaira vitifoliae]